MNSQDVKNAISGVLVVDKPVGMTSHDVVQAIRNGTGIRRAGHTGTLDPLATGLMIICTGKATKRIDDFKDLDKEYVATFHFGKSTPSFDLETETEGDYPVDHITKEMVENTLKGFLGGQKQMPPLHSAKFIDGKRAYEYARKGIEKEMSPVNIFFREIDLLSFGLPETRIRLLCSKGTYIRSFARDLGAALNSGCYLSALERIAIGHFKVTDAFSLEKFDKYLKQLKQI